MDHLLQDLMEGIYHNGDAIKKRSVRSSLAWIHAWCMVLTNNPPCDIRSTAVLMQIQLVLVTLHWMAHSLMGNTFSTNIDEIVSFMSKLGREKVTPFTDKFNITCIFYSYIW